MILAFLVAFIFISGGIAVHQYLREHPPPDLGRVFGRIYSAEHPKAKARAVRDAKALKRGEVESDGAMVALGHLLWFSGRALGRLGRKVAEHAGRPAEYPAPDTTTAAAEDTPPAEATASAGPEAEQDTPPAEAEQDTPPPDAAPATAPQGGSPMTSTTTLAALYEASEAAAAQDFEGVVAVERFLKAVATGCESVTSVWGRWAERLAGPLNVDESVVGHIRACAPHQATIAGLTGEASSHVTKLLDGSIADALERGDDVPHHKLMNSAAGYPAIPAFYDRFGTYITHKREDIRGELLLMAAVKVASGQQAAMFRAAARRMEDSRDINVRAGADRYYSAARTQDAITALVEAAHVQFAVIIRMTIRALAESSMKAPNAQMHGVG